MGPDAPLIETAAVRDRLDVEKALVRVARGLAVQEKTGDRGPRLRHQGEFRNKSKKKAFKSMGGRERGN